MKMNKKGMTLVECIVAMGVFAVATTGFTMAATACMRAQAKSHIRNRTANVQTTNLEHFSNYSDVIDLNELNVSPMDPGAGVGDNMYQMTFSFHPGANGTVVNRKIHGYRSVIGEGEDGVFELSFFSPIDQVSLEPNEYWFTLYNCSADDVAWDITCESGYIFFDNEKNGASTALPTHIWAGGGSYKRFGIRDINNAGINTTITLSNPITGQVDTVPLADKINVNGEDDRYGFIYYIGGAGSASYQNQAQFNS